MKGIEKRMTGVFEDFTVAMVQPSRYVEFLKKKKRETALFVIILVVITSLATVVYPLVTMGRMIKEFYTYDVPYFKVENGIMKTEDEFELKNDMIYIGISNEKEYNPDDAKNYNVALLADKDSFVVKNYNQLNSAEYSEFGNQLSFDKDFIYMFKNFFIFVMVFSGIILLAINFIGYFLGAWIVKWITSGFIRAYGINVSPNEHYKLCVYSRTVPVIVSALLSLANIVLPYVISVLISVFYLKSAFRSIKMNDMKACEEQSMDEGCEVKDDED